MLMNYGQPMNGVVQFAYTTDDIEESIRRYVEVWGIGPWYLAGPFSPEQAKYRGRSSSLSISLATAFSGHIMLELIQQHDDGPSVYQETIERVGFGFHHIGVITDRYDEEVARYGELGYELAFFDVLQGGRIAYFDTTRDMPGMTELIELTPAAEFRQTRVQRASLGWDGAEPIRRVSLK